MNALAQLPREAEQIEMGVQGAENGKAPEPDKASGALALSSISNSMVALVGRFSSPSGPLKTLLEQSRWEAKDAGSLVPPPDIGARHRRVGWVVRAVEQILAEQGEPMQAKAVHGAVEALLGQAVSWSSIKGALADHAAGPSSRFVRVGRGRYRLAH